ncbi:DUF3090 domain-containing protein [Nocardioides caldifontis]|uniref:DUF3090 domain-containing protein n=1 Tax=Nocardioides caldifontis TaxID=2588938 RepID=UPI0011DFD396|nr:DUF3090 domain-containing protein [Nocardioides caldifontis]
MPVVHRYDSPERFVAGTVGAPGQRTFFLQARDGARLTSVALEKQQVSVLAERIDGLLDELLKAEGGAAVVPAVTPTAMEDVAPLDQPIEEEFRAGTMTLAWDGEHNRIVIEVFALDDSDDGADEEALVAMGEEPTADEVLVVSLTPAAARAFCTRAQAVVAAGRPSCQFCGGPMDPDGHLCPRANGFRRR